MNIFASVSTTDKGIPSRKLDLLHYVLSLLPMTAIETLPSKSTKIPDNFSAIFLKCIAPAKALPLLYSKYHLLPGTLPVFVLF